MVFISKQLPITIVINDVSYEHDKLKQCFCYCCLAENTMTMKVHELRHIALFVKAFGPLWVFSCFPYENANGHLKGLVHGTRYIASQVCSTDFCVGLFLFYHNLNWGRGHG